MAIWGVLAIWGVTDSSTWRTRYSGDGIAIIIPDPFSVRIIFVAYTFYCCDFILPYITRSILGYELNGAITRLLVRMFTNMCDQKRACLLGSERTTVSTGSSSTRSLLLNCFGNKGQHRGTSRSIYYIYFPPSMESQGQCPMISARSSADVAAANASAFICLLSAMASS